MEVKIRTALISVSDKSGVVEFARKLSEMGVKIISTGGTSKVLTQAGIKVVSIESVTGFPEMMDGRVKTLHPKIHGGLLAIRENDTHAESMKKHGIDPIDMVCVNLYPFEKTITDPNCTWEMAIENIDIGGPSMVRSSAKNHQYVTVVTSPEQYDCVLEEMHSNDGAVNLDLRRDLARAAFAMTAAYDAAIAAFLNKHADIPYPDQIILSLSRDRELRYGENPHQTAAYYTYPSDGEVSVGHSKLLPGGTPISFNNLMDANAAFELVKEFEDPAVVVVKHMNPCGCAVDPDIRVAYEKAYLGDVVSAFGGIIAINRNMDQEMATIIMESYDRFGKDKGASGFFAEVIVAPNYSPEALHVLRNHKTWGQRVRLLETGPMVRRPVNRDEYDVRCIVGGLLVQQRDLAAWEPAELSYPTKRKPSDAQLEDLRVAWIVAKHTKSNAITLVKDRRLVGVGAGQMNRVESGKIAIAHAGELSHGSSMGSDAFFPFSDNIENAARAGIACVIQPGGSKKDDEVIRVADELGIAMVFTGKRHFRH